MALIFISLIISGYWAFFQILVAYYCLDLRKLFQYIAHFKIRLFPCFWGSYIFWILDPLSEFKFANISSHSIIVSLLFCYLDAIPLKIFGFFFLYFQDRIQMHTAKCNAMKLPSLSNGFTISLTFKCLIYFEYIPAILLLLCQHRVSFDLCPLQFLSQVL